MIPRLRRYIALLLIICTLTSLIACSADQPEETTVEPTETEPAVTEPIEEAVETLDIIKDGKLLPPFVAISGLGESAAWDLMEGRQGKTFLSVEEVAAACPKVSKTHIQMLKDAGAFGDMPDTSQVSLF